MDGFTGFKTAATEEVPHAAAVMDPFHVVRLAGDAVPVEAALASRFGMVSSRDAAVWMP